MKTLPKMLVLVNAVAGGCQGEGARVWRRVVLRTDRPALSHGDGEILGETPVEIVNLPRAIRILAPAGR